MDFKTNTAMKICMAIIGPARAKLSGESNTRYYGGARVAWSSGLVFTL